MSVLIACSYEVGGQPFRMAETLNRHGLAVSYLSLPGEGSGHDSTRFHHGEQSPPWDLTARIRAGGASFGEMVARLATARRELGITAAFATGADAHLVGRAGIPYRYWSYGSDLDFQSFAPIWPEGYPALRRAWAFARFALGIRRRQRRSLRRALAVMIAPYQKAALDRVRPGAPLFFLPHVLRVEDAATSASRRSAEHAEVRARAGGERYVFSSTRHVWHGTLAAHTDYKGNDIALRAFARYRARGGAPGVRLVLVRKGPDVEASRRLAEQLGLAPAVTWLEEMRRDDLAALYRGAELCLGQFGTPAITNAMLEPLAEGSPCLSHFTHPHPGVPGYPVPPPGKVSRVPEEIAGEIGRLLADPEARAEAGERSRRWVQDHCSEERFVEAFRALFMGEVGRDG